MQHFFYTMVFTETKWNTMITKAFYFLFFIALICFSCKSDQTADHQASQPIEGVWQAVGYGKLLSIEGEAYTLYDVTKISCLPAENGQIASFGEDIMISQDTLVINKGTGVYHYTKIPTLPNLCTDTLSDEKKLDPVYNFEVMAQTIGQHFAYFDDNNINWDSLYQASKSKVSPTTTEVELYLVLEEIVQTLKDNHGYVAPTDEVYEAAEALQQPDAIESPIEEEPRAYGDLELAYMTAKHYLGEGEMTRGSKLIRWGEMAENTGYIQVMTMWLYADLDLSDSLVNAVGFMEAYVDAFMQLNEGEYIKKEVQGVSKIMDSVMHDLKAMEQIVLDIRFNGGGQDAVSMEILRRFNAKKVQVATKSARLGDGYTKTIPIYLEASKQAYQKPVYLLTSPQTGSAADFLALASMELPQIQRVGSHSSGALSDALEKKLPNGWGFSLSNEVYKDNKGICYESVGIPVDHELGYNEDRQTFFRHVAHNLEEDKRKILAVIEALEGQ